MAIRANTIPIVNIKYSDLWSKLFNTNDDTWSPKIFPMFALVPQDPAINPLLDFENHDPIMETKIGNTRDYVIPIVIKIM